MGIYHPKTSRHWWAHFQYQRQRQFVDLGITYLGKVSDRKLAEEAYHRKRADFIQMVERGVETDPRLTLGQLVDEYMRLHSKPNKRTWKDDEEILKRFKAFYGENFAARKVTPHSLEIYKAERIKKVTPVRVNRELAALKSMYSKAVMWGKVPDNPVKRVALFKENNKRDRFLSVEEKEKLLGQSPDWLRDILIVALNTGLRKGELVALKWIDVNLNQRDLIVRHSKSGKARHIPINSGLYEALKRQPKRGLHVFTDESGTQIRYNGRLRKIFEKLVEALEISDFRFHDLRHTFASELAMNGVDIKTIAELLGHGSTRMTERYMHLSPSHKRDAVEKLVPQKSPASVNRT